MYRLAYIKAECCVFIVIALIFFYSDTYLTYYNNLRNLK